MSVQETAPPVIPVAPHQIGIIAYGTPAPEGSKKIVRGNLIDNNPAALRSWRREVTAAAVEARQRTPGWTCMYPAIIAHFAFTLPRPQYHYHPGTRSRAAWTVLRDDAPHVHAVRPDLDKLVRAVCDALTDAGVYPDDSRVAQLHAAKVYPSTEGAGALARPGVRVVLTGVTR